MYESSIIVSYFILIFGKVINYVCMYIYVYVFLIILN